MGHYTLGGATLGYGVYGLRPNGDAFVDSQSGATLALGYDIYGLRPKVQSEFRIANLQVGCWAAEFRIANLRVDRGAG